MKNNDIADTNKLKKGIANAVSFLLYATVLLTAIVLLILKFIN
tara:strand:+ start:5368 stop:5496 length:129 start_codon:yes stop_codon:yes gene_type:complete